MFITPNDIADRLEELVAEKFEAEPVYRELVETDFVRPSTLIVQDKCEVDVDMGCGIVEMRPSFALTTYVKVDEYHHSHLPALHLRQMTLLGLFLPGYIKVGDRAPKVKKLTMTGGYDFDSVVVAFSYTLDRDEFLEIEQRPMMEQLHLNGGNALWQI